VPAKIRVLPETVINQIAAGEIIENPASLIKELIENAVDASAKKIEIHLQAGGYHSIEVIDDGCGMSSEDSILCFERHATSKIKQFDDLMRLKTMGFRGEALASIAATSMVELETAEEGQTGTKVICNGGKIIKAMPFARSRGTTIRVNSLFYNVPARKKFQKSPNQSTTDIVKMVSRVALAHKGVSIKLFSMNKELVYTSLKEELRIEEVLGLDFLKDTKPVSFKKDGIEIAGIIGIPSNVKTNRLAQYLIVNERPVISNLIEKAILSAYGTRIGSREFPVFVIWLNIDPEKLDVNIHPQKTYVKFAEEDKISLFIKKAVEESFYSSQNLKIDSFALNDALFKEVLPLEPKNTYFLKSAEPQDGESKNSNPPFVEPIFVGSEERVLCKQPLKLAQDFLMEEDIEVLGFYNDLCFVKVPRYLPFFQAESLILVDLGRLDAKIQFERFLKRLAAGGDLESEILLFPEVLHFSKSDALLISKNVETLIKFGIGIREFGSESFIVDSLSSLYAVSDIKKVLDLLIMEFSKDFTFEGVLKIILRFKPSKIHTGREVVHLIKEVLETKDPFYSPFGKLIFKEIKKDEIFDT
jgi:DNA mismatch repair protein MutL